MKKSLALVLSVAMVLSMMVGFFTFSLTTSAAAATDVTITPATGEAVTLNATKTTYTGATGTATYDAAKGELTINNLTGVKTIYTESGSLTVIANGTNTLDNTDADKCLNVGGTNDLTVKGSGTLNLIGKASVLNVADGTLKVAGSVKVNVTGAGTAVVVNGTVASLVVTDDAQVTILTTAGDAVQVLCNKDGAAPKSYLEVSGNGVLQVNGSASCGYRVSASNDITHDYLSEVKICGNGFLGMKEVPGQGLYVNGQANGFTNGQAVLNVTDHASVKLEGKAGSGYPTVQVQSKGNKRSLINFSTDKTIELIGKAAAWVGTIKLPTPADFNITSGDVSISNYSANNAVCVGIYMNTAGSNLTISGDANVDVYAEVASTIDSTRGEAIWNTGSTITVKDNAVLSTSNSGGKSINPWSGSCIQLQSAGKLNIEGNGVVKAVVGGFNNNAIIFDGEGYINIKDNGLLYASGDQRGILTTTNKNTQKLTMTGGSVILISKQDGGEFGAFHRYSSAYNNLAFDIPNTAVVKEGATIAGATTVAAPTGSTKVLTVTCQGVAAPSAITLTDAAGDHVLNAETADYSGTAGTAAYDFVTKTLTLNNLTGVKKIAAANALTIVANGTSTVGETATVPAVDAKDLTIKGNGTINFNSSINVAGKLLITEEAKVTVAAKGTDAAGIKVTGGTDGVASYVQAGKSVVTLNPCTAESILVDATNTGKCVMNVTEHANLKITADSAKSAIQINGKIGTRSEMNWTTDGTIEINSKAAGWAGAIHVSDDNNKDRPADILIKDCTLKVTNIHNAAQDVSLCLYPQAPGSKVTVAGNAKVTMHSEVNATDKNCRAETIWIRPNCVLEVKDNAVLTATNGGAAKLLAWSGSVLQLEQGKLIVSGNGQVNLTAGGNNTSAIIMQKENAAIEVKDNGALNLKGITKAIIFCDAKTADTTSITVSGGSLVMEAQGTAYGQYGVSKTDHMPPKFVLGNGAKVWSGDTAKDAEQIKEITREKADGAYFAINFKGTTPPVDPGTNPDTADITFYAVSALATLSVLAAAAIVIRKKIHG